MMRAPDRTVHHAKTFCDLEGPIADLHAATLLLGEVVEGALPGGGGELHGFRAYNLSGEQVEVVFYVVRHVNALAGALRKRWYAAETGEET